ncbi:MAG: hypothetical protein ABID87_08435 [Chloroflexota bacterium]
MTRNGADDLSMVKEHDPAVETDLPPEYCHYRDEGCELADSCLNCPLAKCVYDEPGGKQRWRKRLRDRDIVRLFSEEKQGVRELARFFRLSERTIQRALKGDRAKERTDHD